MTSGSKLGMAAPIFKGKPCRSCKQGLRGLSDGRVLDAAGAQRTLEGQHALPCACFGSLEGRATRT